MSESEPNPTGIANAAEFEQKHLEFLAAHVQSVFRIKRYGSFSERNPSLGKMHTCNQCGTRLRDSQYEELPCCHPVVSVEIPNIISRAMLARRRFRPHRSQRSLVVWQLANEYFEHQDDPEVNYPLLADIREMHGGNRVVVDDTDLRKCIEFAQSFVDWKRGRASREIRRRQQRSRQINRRAA